MSNNLFEINSDDDFLNKMNGIDLDQIKIEYADHIWALKIAMVSKSYPPVFSQISDALNDNIIECLNALNVGWNQSDPEVIKEIENLTDIIKNSKIIIHLITKNSPNLISFVNNEFQRLGLAA
jgi:hypothetical protein